MAFHSIVDRRTVLRGMLYGGATSIALPLFEQFLNGNGVAYADVTTLPNRYVLLFSGNGTRLKHWIPARTGPDYELSPILRAYAPVKQYVNVITGASFRVQGVVHHRGHAAMMTAAPYIDQSMMGRIRSTVSTASFDQTMAATLGNGSRFKSLQIGVQDRVNKEEGTNPQFLSHNGPDDPNPPEYSPAALFKSMFGDTALNSTSSYGSV